METLQEKLEQLEHQLKEWEAQSPRNQSKIDAINIAIGRIKDQIAESEAREQAKEEMKVSFELPHNYDEVFERHGVNKEMMKLIGQVIDQAHEYFEALLADKDNQIAGLRGLIRDKDLELSSEREQKEAALSEKVALETKVQELTEKLQASEEDLAKSRNDASTLRFEKNIAESSRDAAANEIDELKEQLRAKTPAKSVNLDGKFTVKLTSSIESTPIKSSQQLTMERLGMGHLYVGNKMEAPTLAPQEGPFLPEMAPSVVGQSTDIPTIEKPVTPEQFRGSDENVDQPAAHTEDSAGTSGDNASSSDDASVSLADRVKALEADVEVLKRRSGMVA